MQELKFTTEQLLDIFSQVNLIEIMPPSFIGVNGGYFFILIFILFITILLNPFEIHKCKKNLLYLISAFLLIFTLMFLTYKNYKDGVAEYNKIPISAEIQKINRPKMNAADGIEMQSTLFKLALMNFTKDKDYYTRIDFCIFQERTSLDIEKLTQCLNKKEFNFYLNEEKLLERIYLHKSN